MSQAGTAGEEKAPETSRAPSTARGGSKGAGEGILNSHALFKLLHFGAVTDTAACCPQTVPSPAAPDKLLITHFTHPSPGRAPEIGILEQHPPKPP